MQYAIITNTEYPEALAIATNYEGDTMLFDDEDEAYQYAETNINFGYKVIEVF